MFGGEVDVDDCLGHTSWRRDDEVKSSRNFLVHVDDGQAGFFTKRNRQILSAKVCSLILIQLNAAVQCWLRAMGK